MSQNENNNLNVGSDVIYHTDDAGKSVEGFIAYPDPASSKEDFKGSSKGASGERHPAVILIHEWWGHNQDVRQQALNFAKEGYVALAVDLYGGGENTIERTKARELSNRVEANIEETVANLKDAIRYLENDPRVEKGKIATVGWSIGGRWAYEIAKRNLGVIGTVIYYGRFGLEDDDLSTINNNGAVMGHFCVSDAVIKIDDARELKVKLEKLSDKHEVYIYDEAAHGFANYVEGIVPQVYDEKADKLSWKRTVDFLNRLYS